MIVVGGGHAGCEAAAAAARMGARTALVTLSFATVGAMSCNPAIGGLGKGHLVREIDALDGLMGRVADQAGIQFRVLNRAKGPAVRGPRAQADRKLYREAMQAAIQETGGLQVIEAEAADILLERWPGGGDQDRHGRAAPLRRPRSDDGNVSQGHDSYRRQDAFRPDAWAKIPPSVSGSGCKTSGLGLGRLKTGTPPRLDGRTIDWSMLERQSGDREPEPFSFLTGAISTPQIDCFITHTTPEGHALIEANLGQSPVYSGAISGLGPRYCPSIEDKIVRFKERETHQIFLEPEGLDDPTIYPNGISTALPEEVQLAFVRTIPGLSKAAILRPGYAIEYDYIDPRGLTLSLETQANSGPLSRGADQWHDRLRRSGRARSRRGPQRRAAGGRPGAGQFQPRRRLSWRDDRRSRHEGRQRALPDVHLARRIPALAACRQCRSAADGAWRQPRLRWRGAGAALCQQGGGAFDRARALWKL